MEHTLKITNRRIRRDHNDRVVQNNINTDTIKATFDAEWNSCTRYLAIFVNSTDKERRSVQMAGLSSPITIPWETLQTEGFLFVSFVGYKNNDRLVTEVMDKPYIVAESGCIDGTSSQTPTPDEVADLVETLEEALKELDQTEQARAQAEATRQSNETRRETQTAQAIKDANAARDSANSAAQKAQSAATGATTATEQANAARDEANSAAEKANMAAGKAEPAAERATTAAENAESATKAATEAAERAETANSTATEAEQARAQAEATRENAEKSRTEAESTRADAEAERVAAEALRANSEQAREEAETERADYYNELKQAVDAGDYNGATFTPTVSDEGIISWSNDKSLPNPKDVDIKGPVGEGLLIRGVYDSEEALKADHPSGDRVGDGYMVADDYYIWDGTAWQNAGPLQGAPGADGKDAVIVTATATADNLTSDEPTVTVDVGGVPGNQSLTFAFSGIKGAQGDQGVRGDRGEQGEAGADAKIVNATASIDGTSSDDPTCTVEVSGEPGNQTLTFAFQGIKGMKGDDGSDANIEFATQEEVARAITELKWSE